MSPKLCSYRSYTFCSLLILVFGLVLSLVLGSMACARMSYMEQLFSSTDTQKVVVREGDSLWNLAESYAVEGISTKYLVEFIMDVNDLESAELHPGDVLYLPVTS